MPGSILEGNTIVANWSNTLEAAVYVGSIFPRYTVFGNNITHNVGPGIRCLVSPPGSIKLECNNLFSNGPGGQIVGDCTGSIGEAGNISVDPEYGRGTGCPSSSGDWCLGPNSPLLPQNSPPGCGLIGALGLCPPISAPDIGTELSSSFRALPARPNPFFERTTIAFYLPAPGEVEISIYGVLGRKIRTVGGPMRAGDNELDWDGREDGGAPAASGAYVAVIRSAGREVTRTLLLVR